jgi:Retroviral aspartyl protease
MLHGRFGDTSGAPYLEAHISFPRLRLRGFVSFLIDTGADGTILMPADSKKLRMDFSSLRNPTTSEGIGGISKGYNERGVISFSDRRHIYTYVIKMEIAGPTVHNHRFPSLLGRDILKQWRLIIDTAKNRITCTPRTWNLRTKI